MSLNVRFTNIRAATTATARSIDEQSTPPSRRRGNLAKSTSRNQSENRLEIRVLDGVDDRIKAGVEEHHRRRVRNDGIADVDEETECVGTQADDEGDDDVEHVLRDHHLPVGELDADSVSLSNSAYRG